MSLSNFLVTFETDNLMVRFLSESLDNVLRTLMWSFFEERCFERSKLCLQVAQC